jgi:hypothetical protein
MQITYLRYVVLSLIFLAGAGLYAITGQPLGVGTPRWPAESSPLYAVDGWTFGPLMAQQINSAEFVSRTYRNPDGVSATLTIETYQTPKLYAAGPEVPFLGNGYSIATAQAVAPVSGGIGSLVATRGDEQWLVMYGYGERRGLLGNGPVAWSFAFIDLMLGRANDYYKLYLTVPTTALDASTEQATAELTDVLFPRIQSWYAKVQ